MIKASTSRRALAALALVMFVAAAFPGTGKSGVGQTTEPAVRRDNHVIIVSIDGLPPDYYTNSAAAGLRVPNLTALKLDGAYADGMEGIYPSVTYPAHTTLATGVRPARHGVVQNRVFEAPTEPQTRAWYWYSTALKTETLWTLAKKAGLVTAAVGWPVTASAEIDYNAPEIWAPGESLATMKSMRQHATPGLFEKASEANPGKEIMGDDGRTTLAEYIITAAKPNLLLVHLIELDDAHHKNGPRTPAALAIAEMQDSFIGRIVEATRKAGIYDKTTFFVVSDHGFAAVDKRFYPNVVLAKEKMITLDGNGKPTDWKAFAWTAGGSSAIVLRDPNDKETAQKVTDLFSRMAKKEKSPIDRVVTRTEMERLGAVPQAVLMIDAASGYTMADGYTGSEVSSSGGTYRGTHGQLPSKAEMRASLIASGFGVRSGARVPVARMLDIAPTAAALLGLTIPNAEGRPIVEILKPGIAPPTPRKQKEKRSTAGVGGN